jgi:hypothetical protein
VARKSYRKLPDVEAWVGRQGYVLERATAAAFRPRDFVSTLGRHFVDGSTGKAREIDLVSQFSDNGRVSKFAIVECKRSPSGGAWIARESAFSSAHKAWTPIMSPQLSDFAGEQAKILTEAFELGRDLDDHKRVAFSVTESTDESNDVAYAAIRQAVDGAIGWSQDRPDAALCVPVVVMDVPLFALHHAEGGDEPLVEIPWRRLLWTTANGQTIVDVVTAGHLDTYARILRTSFLELTSALGAVARRRVNP